MKFKSLVFSLVLLFVGVCAFRTPLEARSHISFNFGAFIAPRAAPECCVIERYPVIAEPVYVYPAPVFVAPRPHHFHEVRIYRAPAPCPFCY
jgi:hypothetical protein